MPTAFTGKSTRRFAGVLSATCAVITLLILTLISGTPASAEGLPPAELDAPGANHQVFLPTLFGPPPRSSSAELIDAALKRGEITEETALIYKVFAEFGDDRLPQRYRGADRRVRDGDALDAASLRLGTLSAEGQATLRPFLLPPSAPGSWLELAESAAGAQSATGGPQAIQWSKIPAAGNRAVVWYQKRYAAEGDPKGDKAKAELLAKALSDKIWPELTKLMGLAPEPDGKVQPNGGDDRLDIYLVHFGPGSEGDDAMTVPYAPFCPPAAVNIQIESRRDAEDLPGILAHEFMHALQRAFKSRDECQSYGEYKWLREATATWAEDFVYRGGNTERYADPLFTDAALAKTYSLEDLIAGESHDYAAYQWFMYLHHAFEQGQTLIRDIWQQTQKLSSLAAIDASVPGGFAATWPEFAKYVWNQEPVDRFKQWDVLEKVPWDYRVLADPGDEIHQVFDLPLAPMGTGGVPHLSAQYFSVDFTESTAASVSFYNGWTYKLSDLPGGPANPYYGQQYEVGPTAPDAQAMGARVQALIQLMDGSWREEDWSAKPQKDFCRTKASENIKRLILVVSNSSFKTPAWELAPQGLASRIWVSKVGCKVVDINLKGAPDGKFPLPLFAEGGPDQAVDSYRLTFTDDSVRTVAIYNGLTFKLQEKATDWYGVQYVEEELPAEAISGARVTGLLKLRGRDDWVEVDYTSRDGIMFCRSLPSSPVIEEMVLVYEGGAAGSGQVVRPQGLPPTVWASDIHCGQWQGQVIDTWAAGNERETSTWNITLGNPYMSLSGGQSLGWVLYRPAIGSSVHIVHTGVREYYVDGVPQQCPWRLEKTIAFTTSETDYPKYLELTALTTSGDKYRRLDLYLRAIADETVTSCPGGSFPVRLGGWVFVIAHSSVSPSGTLLQGSYTSYGGTREWRLEAIR